MKTQKRELLDSYPAERFRRDVERKIQLQNAQEEHARTRPSGFSWRLMAGALTACLALLFILPPVFDNGKNPGSSEISTPDEPGIRIKGDTIHLVAHLINMEARTKLVDGDSAKAGDRIQLSIDRAKGRSFVIFSIDGSGVISLHYPLVGEPVLEERTSFSLPTSAQLDDAPHFEEFYLVSSDTSLNKEEILAKANEAKEQAEFRAAFRSLIPEKVTINSLSLKKEEK